MEINWQPDFLESDIVSLVPMDATDFEAVYVVASDPLIWEQHPANDRYKREVFQKFFDDAINGNSSFKIIDKISGQIIGSTRYYDFDADKKQIAIGYTFLAKEFWGGTYNQSVKKLLIDYAFQFVDAIVFHIAPMNFRSQQGTMKTGAKKVREITKNGNPSFEYAIQKTDWKNLDQ
ncbi:GNAT family N-acetyltransferase [Flavobacterium silvaticum]|uniref:GNAT family N-acetyltransferase n=1 Tax=Flavobacterium silvaticum TaxID=1852020 RepID=A0A972FMG6_9FLAO|nr:GNAT family N-acetyltransferase [Flavobacterium silvaticum]NMH27925.1 GNAT family N-acetyltransferase [Flavobacterium silvaticum]